MKIWTLHIDTENAGTNLAIYANEAEAQGAYLEAVRMCWARYLGENAPPMPDDPQEAYDRLYNMVGFADQVALQEHITPLPDAQALRAALGQLLDQVHQMQGLFDDEDGAIARAVADAEEALSA